MSARVIGKFLHVGGERFLLRGIAYGTFAPNPAADGDQFPTADRVASDFGAMVRAGINTVRTYTAPCDALLDQAANAGLRLFAGVPWAQHVAFLDDRKLARAARQEIVRQVRRLAQHPATLLVAIGNEIPAGIVRWHGASRVEQFLRETYDEAKAAAPDAVLAYVNYPPTDYLDLACFDVCAFNVYLHREADLRAYVAHLQLGRRRTAAGPRRGGGRQPARGGRRAGGARRHAGAHRVRRRGGGPGGSSPGPMTGGEAAPRWTTGSSA